ncbi:hypothetical protein E1A91_A07G129800v1 [Gossypium mustelinum]|uniref:Uncharacterized protein n=1 Tax=Gossypium mustelinum TaxID=34275 RepID=A0A5D2YK55_GOSMU|nr:hypothetical protein E1A91_A07G129800v1 [Gossypium mustelinum]
MNSPVSSISIQSPCSSNKKRAKSVEEERLPVDKPNNHNKQAGTSRGEEDLRSSAESSVSKRQSISSMSFSVPQSCSSSDGRPMLECESSDMKRS